MKASELLKDPERLKHIPHQLSSPEKEKQRKENACIYLLCLDLFLLIIYLFTIFTVFYLYYLLSGEETSAFSGSFCILCIQTKCDLKLHTKSLMLQ